MSVAEAKKPRREVSPEQAEKALANLEKFTADGGPYYLNWHNFRKRFELPDAAPSPAFAHQFKEEYQAEFDAFAEKHKASDPEMWGRFLKATVDFRQVFSTYRHVAIEEGFKWEVLDGSRNPLFRGNVAFYPIYEDEG